MILAAIALLAVPLWLRAVDPSYADQDARSPSLTCWGKERAADNYTIVYTQRLVVRQPRRCSLLGPNVDDANGAILHRLKWHSWGSRTATASGYSQSLGANSAGAPTEFPARVSVTGIRTRNGRRWYSRMSITSQSVTNHYRLSSPTARDYETF